MLNLLILVTCILALTGRLKDLTDRDLTIAGLCIMVMLLFAFYGKGDSSFEFEINKGDDDKSNDKPGDDDNGKDLVNADIYKVTK